VKEKNIQHYLEWGKVARMYTHMDYTDEMHGAFLEILTDYRPMVWRMDMLV